LSAIANFLWLPNYPVWSIILIGLAITLIWARTRHESAAPPVDDYGCLPMIWLLDRRWTTQAVPGPSSSPAALVGPSPARLSADDLVTGSSVDYPGGSGAI
jgi:hypothetical protein